MSDFIAAIQTAMNSNTMWENVTDAAPFIGIVAVFVFGYFIVRKVVRGAAKGRLNF